MSRALTYIALFSVFVILTGCDKVRGAAVVRELCAKDGGERILATTFVDGYLNEAAMADDCPECREQLGRGDFRYIDLKVPTGLGLIHRLSLPAGYYRFSIAAKDDPHCSVWTRRPNAEQLFAKAEIPPERCIAVTALQEQPSGYSFIRATQDIVVDGVPIQMSERAVLETVSRKRLATLRDYQFTAKLTALLDMSGRGGNPDARCLDTRTFIVTSAAMPTRVLRDERQRGVQAQ